VEAVTGFEPQTIEFPEALEESGLEERSALAFA
jgi:hypothetical protein